MFVRKFIRQKLPILLIIGLILAGCNIGATQAPTLDVTSVVGTTVALLSVQFTQTALAVPSPTSLPADTPASLPTFALPTLGDASPTAEALPTISFNATPLPGFTQLASPVSPVGTTSLGDACDNSAFIGDVTIPDGSVIKPGVNFKKTWAIKNTGTCTWDEGYALVFIAGDRAIDPVDVKIKQGKDFILGGTSATLSVNLTAPLAEGPYQGHWRMLNDRGFYFGTILSVYIVVKK